MHMRFKLPGLFLAAFAAVWSFTPRAEAQLTWNNPANKQWSNNAATWNNNNWWADNNSDLVFAGSGSGLVTNNMTAWWTFSLIFNSGAASFTNTGNSINVRGKIENNSTNTQTINLANISADNGVRELNPVSGDLVINSGNLFLGTGGGGEWRVWGASAKTLTINGVISESGTFRINQNSTVVFQQANTYSGQTLIHAGQLILSNGATVGSNSIVLGGTNTIGASATNALYLGTSASSGGITLTNAITAASGGGASTIGTLNTSGTNTYSGPITLNNSLSVNAVSGGTTVLSGAVNYGSGTGTRIAVGGGGTVISTGTSTSTSDQYQVRIGNGTLIIGNGTIIARTNVQGVGHALDLGVDLNNAIVNATSALRASNGVTVSNSIYVSTTNSQARIIGAAGANATTTFSGPIGLSSANLWLDSTNGQTVTVSGAITNFGGTGNGLVKTNAGLAILSGANTYNGTTLITNGTLRIANNTALGSTDNGTTVGSGAALEFSNNINVVNEALTLNGSGISSGGALRNISGANTNTGAITLDSASRINSDAGTLTLSGAVGLSANTLTVGGAANTIISGAVTGTGGVTKDGAGQLTLSNGANSFGLLTISAGTVVVSNTTTTTGLAGSGGTLNLTSPDGPTQQFIVNTSGSNSYAGTVSGTGQFVKRGTGTQAFTGTYGNTSGIYIDQGTVNFDGSSTVASARIDIGSAEGGLQGQTAEFRLGGTSGGRSFTNNFNAFTNSGSATRTLASENTSGVNTVSGNITNTAAINGGLIVTNASGGALQLSGVVSGTGAVSKTGAGTLVLSGNNSYSGATDISNGVVLISHANALGTTAAGTTVRSGAALHLSNGITTAAEGLTLNGTGDGTGALRNVSGANTYSGAITLGSASLISSTSGAMTLAGNINNAGNLLTISNSGGLGGSHNVTGAISGSGGLTKIGTASGATVTLSNSANSFSGPVTVQGGFLTIAVDGAAGSSSAAYTIGGGSVQSVVRLGPATGSLATLNFSNNANISENFTNGFTVTATSVTHSGNITNNTTTAAYGVADGSISTHTGVLSGSGNLAKSGAGTLVLAGNNNSVFTGNLTNAQGTIRIAGQSNLGQGSVTLSNASVLQVTGAGAISNNITIGAGNGVLSNSSTGVVTYSGSLVKDGTVLTFRGGTNLVTGIISGASANSDLVVDNSYVTLSNVNTYDGPTIITNGGTLEIAVSNAIPDTSNIVLGGGTLITGTSTTGYSDTVGTLTLTANSTIDLGSWTGGAGSRNLNFANSSAITWGAGSTLLITNWSQLTSFENGAYGRIYFGNSSSALTSGQLAQISFNVNGDIYGAKLLSDGELVADIVPIPEPGVYVAASGLLALLGWRERRRLLGLLRK